MQFDPDSPGPICDTELICRGAYGQSMHYRKGRVTSSFIKNADLLNGSLSVWRADPDELTSVERVASILESVAPADNRLFDLFGASAGDVRGVRVANSDGRQVLHIYDDCRTDSAGSKDPQHAVISICRTFGLTPEDREGVLFQEIKGELIKLMKQNVIWGLPLSERV